MLIEHAHHLSKIQEIKLIKNAANAIRILNQAEFLAVIVTNQSVVGRGIISLSELKRIHSKIEFLWSKLKSEVVLYTHHFLIGSEAQSCKTTRNKLFKIQDFKGV